MALQSSQHPEDAAKKPAVAAGPTVCVSVAVSTFDVSDELLHHQEGHEATQDPEADGHRVLVLGAWKEARGNT